MYARHARYLIDSSLAESTRHAYHRAQERFKSFAREKLGVKPIFPYSTNNLVLFVAFLHKSKYSASTITSTLSALGHMHKLVGAKDNTKQFLVSKALLGVRKVSPVVDTRLPITSSVLKELVAALPIVISSEQEATMLRAMFVTAFYGFLRIGEIAPNSAKQHHTVIQYADFNWQGDSAQAVLSIRHSKNSHKVGPQNIVLQREAKANRSICPIRSLKRFLRLRGNTPGPLFMLHGKPCARRLFDQGLRAALVFNRYSTSAYKGHSFRIGAATDAAARGWSDAKIRVLGRWNSDAFRRYIRLAGTLEK